MENEFRRHYKEHVMPALQKRHGYKNVHQIPKVEKVVINTSVGSQSDVKQALEEAKAELALITGQRPMETLAKKSISNFKLRKDQAIGAKVTLRGERMYEFLERFIKAALPRIRDFRGVSPRCFDKHGNYTIGISDQSIFPEVELDKIKRNIGFDVTIVTRRRPAVRHRVFAFLLRAPTQHLAKWKGSPHPFRQALAEFHPRQHNAATRGG